MMEGSDTGAGMPSELVSRVCEPFFTTKEPGRGTGLGLSMVFGFAKQSGGHINVYSEPGQGTTFRLYLPRALAGSAIAAPPLETAVPAAGGSETVLVAQDNAARRRITRRQLTSPASRGADASAA